MRETKFRAWDKTHKLMIHNHLVKELWLDDEGVLIIRIRGWGNDDGTHHDGYELDINSCELMQYTGLHDKNGKEIYEGDILQIPGYPVESNPYGEPDLGVVTFMAGAFGWTYLDYKGRPLGKFETFISWVGETDILQEEQVIGNIYENEELLND